MALARRDPRSKPGRLAVEWAALSDRRFLVWTCAAALAIPLVIRRWLLDGAPLADDEAEALAAEAKADVAA